MDIACKRNWYCLVGGSVGDTAYCMADKGRVDAYGWREGRKGGDTSSNCILRIREISQKKNGVKRMILEVNERDVRKGQKKRKTSPCLVAMSKRKEQQGAQAQERIY